MVRSTPPILDESGIPPILLLPHTSFPPEQSSMSSTDIPRTDITGWRLLVSEDSHGQHKWVYLPADDPRRADWPQSTVDKYWLGLETVRSFSLLDVPSGVLMRA